MIERVRVATPDDAAPIAEIYGALVRDTAITFEVIPPSAGEMRERIERTLYSFPWLVFEEGGVLGYAYASRFRSREAYRWSVELSAYIREDSRRKGIGRVLCEGLLDLLGRQGFACALAGITLPNPPSVGLFESLGFERAGVLRRVGYKLGRWHDVGWWQRSLGGIAAAPDPPIPFVELRAA
jgi:phosphinothricin acetyltransferase